jgi:hypothetical protein
MVSQEWPLAAREEWRTASGICSSEARLVISSAMTQVTLHGQFVTIGDCWTVFTFQGILWRVMMTSFGIRVRPAVSRGTL